MARLFYSTIMSLDGYVADRDGGFEWAMPDAQLHARVNDLMRPAGTHLYGRRLYDVMSAWETIETGPNTGPDQDPVTRDFAVLWQAAQKVVFSRTLQEVRSARTRIERELDADHVRALKDSATADLLIGGGELAAQAIELGLVDDVHVFIVPAVVGGGTPAFPNLALTRFELVDQQRFDAGAVHLHYRVPSQP